MALDDLPGTLETPPRGDIETKFRRDYGIVSPESDTSDGTQPDVLAKTVAITLLPVYSDAVLITNGINEDEATGERLDRVGARYGVPRPQAVGASGYVIVSAAAGGGTIQAGDEIKNRQTGKRYTAASTQTVANNTQVLILGLDTGPATNLLAGTTLQWTSPRPGIGQTAVVGTAGLIGGADVADDATYLALIREARRNPPNGDNDAAIQGVVRSTPGIGVASVFSYPCVFGPGTYAFAFLLATPPGSDPALRIPSAAQRIAALAWMTGQLPGDDSYFCAEVDPSPVTFALGVSWNPGSVGWLDSTTWPAYKPLLPTSGSGAVLVQAASSPTAFTVYCGNGNYSDFVQPQVGQSIALWDQSTLQFFKKTIATVSGTGPCDLTIVTSGGSDTTFQPAVGARVMPWSDSLADVVKPVLAYFNTFGPGEMFASFSSDGRRQRRNPLPPKKYPQGASNDAIVPILALPSVQNAALLEGSGPPSVGVPGLFVNQTTLGALAIFPL